MKDPMRLIDEDGTEFERLLLRAAAQEVPSSDVSARMLAGAVSAGAAVALFSSIQAAGAGALTSSGVASSTVASSVQASSGALSGAGAALGGASGSIAPPAAAGMASAWLLKWGVIGALFSGAVVSGFIVVGSVSLGSASSGNASSGSATVDGKPPLVAPRTPTVVDEVAPAALPADLAPAVAPAQSPSVEPESAATRRASAAPTRAGASSTLGQEVGLLDAARQALAAGDAEGALSRIASYRRRFPHGALEQEATVLEVDALEAKGREQQASSLKEQFLAEHPDSPHTQRVQRSGQTR